MVGKDGEALVVGKEWAAFAMLIREKRCAVPLTRLKLSSDFAAGCSHPVILSGMLFIICMHHGSSVSESLNSPFLHIPVKTTIGSGT